MDSKQRFSDRVENYVRYRPGYPPAVLDHLQTVAGLSPGSVVADVGSGTGISAQPFLDFGNTVYGVEPNPDMRAAAERLLATYPNFHSVDGTAEATGLADGSADLVVAGQAYHWFDPEQARREFRRILRTGGAVVLMWNARRLGTTPFLASYEKLLLTWGTDYQKIRHEGVTEDKIGAFYGPSGFTLATFTNEQRFDYAGLEGRLLSSSYAPAPGKPGHDEMLDELRRIFDAHQDGGRVTIEYDTQVYVGRLD